MLQQRGVPKTIIIFSILFMAGLCLTVFMQGLAYSEGLAVQATSVSGNIMQDTTWTLENSPYGINGCVNVAKGITLTIEPGVLVSCNDGNIIVDGHLQAVGTATNPITFTASNGNVGGWSGILIEDDGSALIDHAVIEKGITGIGIREGYGIVQIQNSLITQNEFRPIYTDHGSGLARLKMLNVTFADNSFDRIFVATDSPSRFELTTDVHLTSQPGLEGYEITDILIIPSGITLTIDPGVTIMQVLGTENATFFIEEGAHLEAVGTTVQPITFTSTEDTGPGEWRAVLIVGSAHIKHANFRNGEINLAIEGPTGGAIILEDSLISNSSSVGMEVSINALHRLKMSNVSFTNNAQNRIRLMHFLDGDQLFGNATLKPMPGLEGYEYFIDGENVSPILNVPEGITLTLQPDTTLLMPESGILRVEGHLWAVGELGHSVTFTPTGYALTNLLADPWTGIVFDTTGTGNLSYANLQRAGVAVGVFGASDRPVFIENSVFANGDFGAAAFPDSLHRLKMENVTFENNDFNYIDLDVSEGDTFVSDTVLFDQPGLEGYLIPTEDPPFTTHDKLVVPEGVHIRMDPGSTLLMADSMRLEVEGSFQISGTAQHMATIQSDSPGNEWAGIVLNGGSVSLNHGELMNAETAVSLQSPTSTLTITNTTFTQNNTGILANAGSVTATCTTFSNNTRGVYLNPGGTGTVNIHQSNLSGNATAGIANEGAGMINAQNNWWGAADGPSGDGPGSGDAVFGNVLYVPWHEAFDCGAAADEFVVYLPMVKRP